MPASLTACPDNDRTRWPAPGTCLPVGVKITGRFLEGATPIDLARRWTEVADGFVASTGFGPCGWWGEAGTTDGDFTPFGSVQSLNYGPETSGFLTNGFVFVIGKIPYRGLFALFAGILKKLEIRCLRFVWSNST